MGVFQNHLMAAAVAKAAESTDFYTYQIANSCRFDSASSSYLYRSPGTASDSTKSTFSCWLKRSTLANMGEASGSPQAIIGSATSEAWEFYDGAHDDKIKWSGGGGGDYITTGEVYRDISAWYHMVFRYDSTQSTAADRVKIYKNGNLIDPSTYTESSYAASSEATAIGNGDPTRIGRDAASADNYFDGYMAEIIFTDGQSYAPTEFGETKNGVWIAKEPSVTFGDNGFHLKFESSGDLGNDSSGNNNDFTSSGLGAHDQMLDSPTFDGSSNGGNFCTINAISRGTSSSAVHYGNVTENNLKIGAASSQDASLPCTFNIPPAGKWYWEYRIDAGGGSASLAPAMGIINPLDWQQVNGGGYTNDALQIVYDQPANKVHKGNTLTATYSGSRGSDGDIMAIAVDMDNGAFYMRKEGTWYTISGGDQGDPTSGSSRTGAGATWTPASEYTGGAVPYAGCWGGTTPVITCNFGQNGTFGGQETAGDNADASGYGNFYSSVPTGYKALCTGNLPTPAADPVEEEGPNKFFKAVTYTGNGTSISVSTGFQTDFAWVKYRDGTYNNTLGDSSRGTGKYLQSDTTAAEQSNVQSFTAFGSDGFTYGSELSGNQNTYPMISWNWKANGGTTTTNDASATGVGSIDSVYQVDTTAGFSIVTYTGSGSLGTLAHGLGAVPKFMMIKNRSDSGTTFAVYAGAAGNGFLEIDNDAAYNSGTWAFNNTDPTSTVFTVNSGLSTSSKNFVAYLWTEKEGFSRFGSYEGNGNADGMFVYTGFRPAWIMTKSVDSTSAWNIFDDQREGYNVDNDTLEANSTAAEATTDMIDILSNGFKFRIATDPNVAETYVYMAFAKNPFKYTVAR